MRKRECSSCTPIHRFGLRDVEYSRRPRTANHLAFAFVWVYFFALRLDERNDLDSVFALADIPTECFPFLEREHVLAWFDLRLGYALGCKSTENRGKVAERLAVNSAPQ